jgi:DNA topoisomerase-1
MVNSQIARRIIDRIIGYPVSNILKNYLLKNKIVDSFDKVKHLGIGRVSAAALALIVENERSIDNYVPESFEKISITYLKDGEQIKVFNDLKFTKDEILELNDVFTVLRDNPHTVYDFEKRTKDVPPPPPLTTTWLQRAANYMFGFSPKKTMKIAQKLYEGVDIEGRSYGLITYIRTDSVYLDENVMENVIDILLPIFGEEYVKTSVRTYTQKDNFAQNAHEAIRPTSFEDMFFPKAVKSYLEDDEYLIYQFIFYRTIATQLNNSIYSDNKLTVQIGNYKFNSKANNRIFDGWEILSKFIGNNNFEEENRRHINTLDANFYIGEVLKYHDMDTFVSKTKTPPRFGVGRFITTLEKNGIARPSTIAEVVSTLESKAYIEIKNNMIIPTYLGIKTFEFLEENISWLVNVELTKEFEDSLDKIALAEAKKEELISEYELLKDEFEEKFGVKMTNMKPSVNKKVNIIGKCPKCGNDVFNNFKGEDKDNIKCSNKDCNFIIWKNNVTSFFNRFGHILTDEEILNFLKVILHKKTYKYQNLISPTSQKKFNASLIITYNEKYKKYQIGFDNF